VSPDQARLDELYRQRARIDSRIRIIRLEQSADPDAWVQKTIEEARQMLAELNEAACAEVGHPSKSLTRMDV